MVFDPQYNASVPLSVFYHATQKLKFVVKQLEESANEREQLAAVEVLHKVQTGKYAIGSEQRFRSSARPNCFANLHATSFARNFPNTE
jgi:hypothetical protein